MNSERPFASRRSRRCAYDGLCVHGGRIARGQRAVRVKPHEYVHAEDGEAFARALDDIAAAAGRFVILADVSLRSVSVYTSVVRSSVLSRAWRERRDADARDAAVDVNTGGKL